VVCYARPALRMAALILVILLVFARPAGHFLGNAALIAAIAAAAAVAAATAVTLAFFLSVRRRRAVTGGCVHCRFRCQHAMTEQSRLLVLRSGAGSGTGSGRAAGPQWPDFPAYRSARALPEERAAGMRTDDN